MPNTVAVCEEAEPVPEIDVSGVDEPRAGSTKSRLGSMLEVAAVLALGVGYGTYAYRTNPKLRVAFAKMLQNRQFVTGAGVIGTISIAAIYIGSVSSAEDDDELELGEDEEVGVTSSGTRMRTHQLERRRDYGVGNDYRAYMQDIPRHVLVYAVPIILAPTAHIVISLAVKFPNLRGPLCVGAGIATFGAVTQRLYLMRDAGYAR